MSTTNSIHQHEGKKYLRTIRSAVNDATVEVDVYAVIEAFGVTCPARQHALKKILCAGTRGKGAVLHDLIGSQASISRAIELQRQREADKVKDVAVQPCQACGKQPRVYCRGDLRWYAECCQESNVEFSSRTEAIGHWNDKATLLPCRCGAAPKMEKQDDDLVFIRCSQCGQETIRFVDHSRAVHDWNDKALAAKVVTGHGAANTPAGVLVSPCTTCGGEAIVKSHSNDRHWIVCGKCSRGLPRTHATVEEAARDWNARCEEARLREA